MHTYNFSIFFARQSHLHRYALRSDNLYLASHRTTRTCTLQSSPIHIVGFWFLPISHLIYCRHSVTSTSTTTHIAIKDGAYELSNETNNEMVYISYCQSLSVWATKELEMACINESTSASIACVSSRCLYWVIYSFPLDMLIIRLFVCVHAGRPNPIKET